MAHAPVMQDGSRRIRWRGGVVRASLQRFNPSGGTRVGRLLQLQLDGTLHQPSAWRQAEERAKQKHDWQKNCTFAILAHVLNWLTSVPRATTARIDRIEWLVQIPCSSVHVAYVDRVELVGDHRPNLGRSRVHPCFFARFDWHEGSSLDVQRGTKVEPRST